MKKRYAKSLVETPNQNVAKSVPFIKTSCDLTKYFVKISLPLTTREFSWIFLICDAVTTVLVLQSAATGLNDVDTTDVSEMGVVGVDDGDGDVPDKLVELLVTDETCEKNNGMSS